MNNLNHWYHGRCWSNCTTIFLKLEDLTGQGKHQLNQHVLQSWKWDLTDLLRHTICNPISSVFVGCTVSTLIYLWRAPLARPYTSFLLVQSFENVPLLHWLVTKLWTAFQDNLLKFAYYCSNTTIFFFLFYISMYTCLLNLRIYNDNKIKRNNTEDTTKTCPRFSFLEKQDILNTS